MPLSSGAIFPPSVVIVGTIPAGSSALSIKPVQNTPDSPAQGIDVELQMSYTANGVASGNAINGDILPTIPAGVVIGGVNTALVGNVTRGLVGGDQGTQTLAVGVSGGYSSGGTGCTTTEFRALSATAINNAPDVLTTYKGLYLDDPSGVIANPWGLYQKGTVQRNFLEGRAIIGAFVANTPVDNGTDQLQVYGNSLHTGYCAATLGLQATSSVNGFDTGSRSIIYGTNTGAVVTYPFNSAGNLIIQSRATATRDIVFVTDSGVNQSVKAKIDGSSGTLAFQKLGAGISIKEGANAVMGAAALVAGTVTVNTTKVTANSRIFLTPQNLSGIAVPAAVGVTARVNNTSFTITSANAADTSTIAWEIIEPA